VSDGDFAAVATLAAAGGAATVGNTPAGNIAATTVQGAINELDTEKAKAGANTDITSLTNLTGGALVNGVAGLGYGPGAGGTVTQATSKSTAVTLNKPCGQITMNNSALSAGSTEAFNMHNNIQTALSDHCIASGANTVDQINYQIWAVNNGAGIVRFFIKNIGTVTKSDALVINFAIIKGATS
jgi:replicative DNA helicase